MRRVGVRDLLMHPGTRKAVRVSEAVEGLRTELAEVPPGRPVGVELLLESVVDGILATGEVRTVLRLRCARCLADFEGLLEERVQALFTRSPGPDEYRLSPEGDLDLEPLVRDTVVPAMPFSPLCRPQCLGLCERCGGNRNLGECACPPGDTDPRWAGLEQLSEETT